MNLIGREALSNGTKLKCKNGDVYTIYGEPIGAGGYSIVYSAHKEGSASLYAIKECFPLDKIRMGFQRTEGIVKSDSEEGKSYLQVLAAQMEKEKEYSQVIYNYSICVVRMLEKLCVECIQVDGKEYSGEDGIFFLMDDIRLKSMSLPQLTEKCCKDTFEMGNVQAEAVPHIRMTAKIISGILNALTKIHTMRQGECLGFIHGDLQMNNIFFQDVDLEQENIGVACLLDLGCMKPIRSDGMTEAFSYYELSGTPGYIPPEIKFGKEEIHLNVQADIYSVGRIFLYLLTGRQYLEDGTDLVYSDPTLRKILPSKAERIGCGDRARELVNHILETALAHEPSDRYETAALMKKDIDRLYEMTTPGKYSLPSNLPGLAAFVGREEEMEEIDRQFENNQGSTPVWLCGPGGIGKTELAIRYGIVAKKEKNMEVYRLVYKKSLKNTIASIRFVNDDTTNLNTEQRFLHNLNIMGQYFQNALFIIDNLEIGDGGINGFLKSKAYQMLIQQPFQILFTTRYDVEYLGLSFVKVGTLREEELMEMISNYYFCQNKRKVLRKLIEEVGGHTLSVELIARTLQMEQERLTPEQLLEYLRKNQLNRVAMVEVMSNQNREYNQDSIYQHIVNLFRFNEFKEEEKTALVHASLYPIEGVDQNIIYELESKEVRTAFEKVLIPRGWVSKTENKRLVMHPMLSDICQKEFSHYLKEEYFSGFAAKCAERINQDRSKDYRAFIGLAGYLNRIGSRLKNNFICRLSGVLYLKCRIPSASLEALKIAMKYTTKNDLKMKAMIYNNLCYAYSLKGDGKNARLFGRKALKVLEENYPEQKEDLADVYNNLGVAYHLLGNTKKRIFYARQALTIQKEAHMDQTIVYAISLNNVASALEENGGFEEAISYYLETIQICKNIYDEEHPLLATFYCNAGKCYIELHDYKSAYEYLIKASNIGEKTLQDTSEIRISVYLNLAGLLSQWKPEKEKDINYGFSEAYRYAEKAREILERTEPKDMMRLAHCYFIISYLQDQQRNCQEAREYGERALQIWKRILPANHPQLMYSYHNLYYVYLHLGDNETADRYRNEELRILKLNKMG